MRHKLIRKGRHGCCYPSPAKPVIFLPLLKCSYHQVRHLKFLTAFTAASVPKLKPMLDCLWNWSFQANCRDHTRPGCVHRRATKRRRQLIWGCAGAWHPASVVSCWGCGALNPLILGNTPREVLHTHTPYTIHVEIRQFCSQLSSLLRQNGKGDEVSVERGASLGGWECRHKNDWASRGSG